LAAEVKLSGTNDTTKFGIEAVPVILKPGVTVRAQTISKKFEAAAFNPSHAKLIARSEKAKPMAVNMYSGWWSLVVCVVTTVLVSLFTKPKPESELTNLVMGLTPMPDEGPCPWYERPGLWATVVLVILIAVNILFW
jgi:solute:Na+ symporter, SSS family